MANPIRLKAINGLKLDDTFTYQRTFTKEDTLLFGDMTRDYNPVHYDERWTDEKGFKGVICHGLLVGSMICEFGGQVGWLATGMDFKFISPVYFGDTIQCTVTITKIEEGGRYQPGQKTGWLCSYDRPSANEKRKRNFESHDTGRGPNQSTSC